MATRDFDVIVVGAGFGGMYLLHRFRHMGMRTIAFETGSDVGDTWYWNRYPGARENGVTVGLARMNWATAVGIL